MEPRVRFRGSHHRNTKLGGPARSFTVADTGISVALLVSFPGRYLEGLGSGTATSSRLAFTDTADVRAVPDPKQRNATVTDVCIVVRTAAGASARQLQHSATTAFNLPGAPSSSTIRPSSRRYRMADSRRPST
jgi:hypothetical protein